MRKLLFGIAFFAAAAQPASAQQRLASVTVEARIRIPDFLFVEQGPVSEISSSQGVKSRQVTLYVKANRGWSLAVKPVSSTETSTKVDYKVVHGSLTGRSGNQIPIVIEVSWNATDPPPPENSLQYVLAAN